MLRSVYITRFLSFLLLIIFALSITPKRFLHNVIAKHHDNRLQKTSGQPYQLANAGYNCDNDNLVAESSFVSDQQIFSIPEFLSFSSHIFNPAKISSTSGIYSRLRGPPVNIQLLRQS